MTTADVIANTARIDRGDKAAEIDDDLNHGSTALQDLHCLGLQTKVRQASICVGKETLTEKCVLGNKRKFPLTLTDCMT